MEIILLVTFHNILHFFVLGESEVTVREGGGGGRERMCHVAIFEAEWNAR